MKNLFTLIIFCAVYFHAVAQAPSIMWEKSLGGTSLDYGYKVQQTTDSGFIVVGYTYSNNDDVTSNHGNQDVWVAKLTAAGSLVWQKSYGGSSYDYGFDIKQTLDGGYIVAAGSGSTDGDVTGGHGNEDAWIIKLDDTGRIQWEKCYGGTNAEWAISIQQLPDSGYIVGCTTVSDNGDVTGNHHIGMIPSYDYWVFRISSTGALRWEKAYGGSQEEQFTSMQRTSDGGYILAGIGSSTNGDQTGNHGTAGTYDYWVVKINDTGAIQWEKSYGGSSQDDAQDIRQTYDGGYIIAGSSASHDGDVTGNRGVNYWVVKIDDTGALQWEKCYGGTDLTGEIPYSIRQTTDSGYIVAGSANSNDGDVTGNHGGADYWVVKISSTGTLTWEKCYGGSYAGTLFGELGEEAYDIEQINGGYVLNGYGMSNDGDETGHHGYQDYWVVRLDCGINAGIIGADRTILCPGDSLTLVDTVSGGVWSVSNGHAAISPGGTGVAISPGTDTVFYTVKNSCGYASASFVLMIGCTEKVASSVPVPVLIAPNPTDGNITVIGAGNVTIKVYNVEGQLVNEAKGVSSTSISQFPAGMYFVRVFDTTGTLLVQGKVIKRT